MTKNQMQTNENIMKITYTLHKNKKKKKRKSKTKRAFF